MTIWNEERILKLNKNSANGLVTAGHISANDMIIWTMIMLPVNIILYGAGQCFAVIGLFAGTVIAWLFLAKRLRSYTELSEIPIENAGDFFFARYRSKGLKYTISILWIIFTGMLLIAILRFAVEIISGYLDISEMLSAGLLIMVIMTVIGILRKKVLHSIKVIVFFFVIIVMIIMIASVFILKEPAQVLDIYGKARLTGGTSIYLNIMYYNGEPIGAIQLLSMLSVGISCIGMPFIFKGIVSVKDNKELDKSRVMAMIFTGMSVVISSVVALLTIVCIYPLRIGPNSNVFQVYNLILHTLYNDAVYGNVFRITVLLIYMFLILILAGSLMRTMAELFRSLIPDKKMIKVNHLPLIKDILVILCLGVIVFFAECFINYDVKSMIALAWDLCGSTLAAPCFACFMWKRSTKGGMYAGILSGLLGYLFWQFIPIFHEESLYEMTALSGLFVAFSFSLVMTGLISAVTKKPGEQEMKTFEQMRINQR